MSLWASLLSLGLSSDAAAFAPAVSLSSSGMNAVSNQRKGGSHRPRTPSWRHYYHACTRAAIKSDAAARGRGEPAALPVHPWSRPRASAFFPAKPALGLVPSVGTGSPTRIQRMPGDRDSPAPSGGSQVLGRRLSGLAVGNDLEGDFLAFLELVEAGALDRADVDEDVLAAVLRLDESVALLRVEPLHGSFGHGVLVFHMRVDLSRARCTARVVSRFWEGRQSGALVAARPSRSAETRWQRI